MVIANQYENAQAMETEGNPPDHNALRRQRAEAVAAAAVVSDPISTTPDEVLRMRHELRVQAIEIAMQHEELRDLQAELKVARARTADGGSLRVDGPATDTPGRQSDQMRLRLVSQLYAASSQCSAAIVQSASEAELLPRVCRAAVTVGGMEMAWIGRVDESSRQVIPVASFGDTRGYLRNIRVRADGDGPFARGPAGTAIRENRPYWCQDFQNDPRTAAWHADGRQAGWAAAAALPLCRNGVPVGVLVLYAGAVNAFGEEIRTLLTGMVGEISFALDGFASEAARQAAEQALRESAALTRAILDSVSAQIAVLDKTGTIVAVNQAWHRFGLDNGILPGNPAPNTGIGTNYLAVCQPGTDAPSAAHAADACAGIRAVLEGETLDFRLEYPCHSASEQRWFSLSVTPLVAARGGVVVSHTDISARARATIALTASETRYRALVEWSPEPVRIHRDGIVIYVNPAAIRLFGARDATELVGKSLFDRIHPDSRERARARLAGTSDQAFAAPQVELRFTKMDGTPIDVEAEGVTMMFEGAPAVLASLHDISERKRAQRMMRDSAARLAGVVESAMDAIVTVDDALQVVLFNTAAAALFEVSREDAMGASIERFIPNLFRVLPGTAGDAMPASRAPGQPMALRANGEMFPIEASVSHVEVEGRQLYTVILRDISRKLLAEQVLIESAARLEQRVAARTAELTATIAELESMTAVVSHDLRAPLHRMAGFAGLLAMEDEVRLNATAQDFSSRIIRSAERMDDLISKLLDNARLGRTALALVELALDKPVAAYVAEVNANLGERRVEWVISALPVVRCDPIMLRQVVQNLVENAVKYSGKKTIARIEIGAIDNAAECGFFVRDNGVGFSIEHAGHLFGIFKRLHTEAEFPGVGIGLANVKRIMQMHGGRVWFEATPGKGATFFAAFPKGMTAAATAVGLADPGPIADALRP